MGAVRKKNYILCGFAPKVFSHPGHNGCIYKNIIFIHFYTCSIFKNYWTNGNEWKFNKRLNFRTIGQKSTGGLLKI